jgi:hypothetical protein
MPGMRDQLPAKAIIAAARASLTGFFFEAVLPFPTIVDMTVSYGLRENKRRCNWNHAARDH